MRLLLLVIGVAMVSFPFASRSAAADANVLMQHNDPGRTGANIRETQLTPATIRAPSFGLLGRYLVVGKVFAQPLVATWGGRRMLYVATAANILYAFDADAPDTPPLGAVRLGPDPVVPSAEVYIGADLGPDIEGGVGVISTPVIDLKAGVIYCLAMSRALDSQRALHHGNPYVWTLYAVNLGPVDGRLLIRAQVEIWHPDFDPHKQLSRVALTLANGRIYTSWGSFGDRTPDGVPPWDGWVLAYGTVAQSPPLPKMEGFLVAQHAHRGGIWQSGGGAAVDDQGFLYVVTGNADGTDHRVGTDWDESSIKLSPNLRITDYYTPSFVDDLNQNDIDLGVSGPMVAPDWFDANGHAVRRLLHGSKQGILYNINRDGMGHFLQPSNHDPVQMVQVFNEPAPGKQDQKLHIHTTPVFWQTDTDRLVFVASDWGLGIKSYRLLQNGRLDPKPFRETGTEGRAITQMSLSANGTHDGVLWAIGCVNCNDDPTKKAPPAWKHQPGVLLAYDASTLAPLFSAGVGEYARFNEPTIANGRVYVANFSGSVDVFGSVERRRGHYFPAEQLLWR